MISCRIIHLLTPSVRAASKNYTLLFPAALPSDQIYVARIFLLVCLAGALSAQSHPSWWTWVSPDATALAGVRWEVLQRSPAGPALEASMFGEGGLALPELDCLKHSRQILFSGPPFLAVASGEFKAATLRSQAPQRGLQRIVFVGVELWIASGSGYSIARLSDQVALIGERATLQSIIEQSQSEGGRRYSPLLPRAALLAEQNLWVVAPDPEDPWAREFAQIQTAAKDAKPIAPAAEPARRAAPPPATAMIAVNGVAIPAAVVTPVIPAVPTAPAVQPTKAATPPRRVIRISGLDDGPREIEIPARK